MNYFRMLNEAFERDELEESRQMDNNFISAFGEDMLARFKAQKNRMRAPENDMGYWIGKKNNEGDAAVAELETFLSNLENKPTNSQRRRTAEEGAELVYEGEYNGDQWKVYHITTYEAAVKYGAQTRWCITGRYPGYENRGQEFFDKYLEGGDYAQYKGYYIAIKNGDEKYCICPHISGSGCDVWNAPDNNIGYLPDGPADLATAVPELAGLRIDKREDDYDDEYEDDEDAPVPVDEPEEPAQPEMEMVQVEPRQVEADSLEDALAQFNMTLESELDDGFAIAKLENGRFTLFLFRNGEASPLYAQRGPHEFVQVEFYDADRLRDWVRTNMPNIQVRDNNHPDNDEGGIDTDEDEGVNEQLLLTTML